VKALTDIDWTTWTPTDTATLVFVVRDDRVLLIRKLRGLGAGKINAPGGRLDAGESPEDCAVRELQEEVRITPRGLVRCGEHRFQFVDGYGIHVFVFLATDSEGDAVETDEAIPLWTPLDAIPWEEMWADDPLWVPLVFARRRFSGHFIFDGETMLDHRLELLAE
jgi:8-oxo-dGTP diphosphatase